MKHFIYFLAIILLIGMNFGVFANLPMWRQIPNLLLLLTLCFSLEKNTYDFFFIAFLSGIFLDFFSTDFFGGFTLGFLALALLLHLLANRFVVFELGWKSLSLLLAGSLLVLNGVFWAYNFFAYKLGLTAYFPDLRVITRALPASFFYNWLLLYPIYLYFNYLKRIVDNLTVRRRGLVR